MTGLDVVDGVSRMSTSTALTDALGMIVNVVVEKESVGAIDPVWDVSLPSLLGQTSLRTLDGELPCVRASLDRTGEPWWWWWRWR